MSHGGSQTYTISAQDGYRIQDVLVNQVSQGPVSSYTFSSVADNGSITASFALKSYTITASVSGSGGSITPLGTKQVSHGGSQTYTISAQEGYRIQDVLVNKVSQGPVSSYTFSSVADNGSITASFAPKTYTITAGVSGSGGTITPTGTTQVSHGGSQTYTISAQEGYRIQDVLVNQVSQGPVSSYTFSKVAGDGSITASFALKSYTITASVSG
nr:hypothetical protein [Syntrophobacteraceae bacterium]